MIEYTNMFNDEKAFEKAKSVLVGDYEYYIRMRGPSGLNTAIRLMNGKSLVIVGIPDSTYVYDSDNREANERVQSTVRELVYIVLPENTTPIIANDRRGYILKELNDSTYPVQLLCMPRRKGC